MFESFLCPVCIHEQDLCPVQRFQTCLASHKSLQNSACAYIWAYACKQTEKPGCGIQERLTINTQHWHAWGHWRAVPQEGPLLPRKKNIFRFDRTDLIIYTMICDSSNQKSPQIWLQAGLPLWICSKRKKYFFKWVRKRIPPTKDNQSSLSSWGNYGTSPHASNFTAHEGKRVPASNQHGLTNGKLNSSLDNGT